MKMNIKSLFVLLVFQLFLAAILIFTGQYRGEGDASGLIINQSADNIVEIVIADETSEVKLLRSDSGWLVVNEADFPADSAKVTRLLESIEAISSQATNIVAVTKPARTRFRVDIEDFNKRIRFIDVDGISEEIFLGNSPGLDLTHIRKSDEDAIHVAKFPTYQASSSSSSWLDKAILKINSEEIVYIGIGEIVLKLSKETENNALLDDELSQSTFQQSLTARTGKWMASKEAGLDRPLSQDAVKELSKQIEGLRFTELVDAAEVNLEAADVLVLLLQLEDGEETKYSIRKSANEDSYYLIASGWDQVFSIGSYTAERLIEASSEEVLFPEQASATN